MKPTQNLCKGFLNFPQLSTYATDPRVTESFCVLAAVEHPHKIKICVDG